jgi:hypothetical protein
VIGWAFWRGRATVSSSRLVLRVATVVAPVVHPWYLGWSMMCEPFAPSAPWLLFSMTAALNYGVFATPAEGSAFHLPLAWRAVEYGLPLALGLSIVIWKRARRVRPLEAD